MHIVLLCSTERGRQFLERLRALEPESEVTVFSFREGPWEPPYLEDIRRLTHAVGGTFFESRDPGSREFADFWATTPMDLLLAVNWRYLVPAAVYRRPRLGSFVFHDSLLPEYRGFSPTVWAIANGEDHTGVTLFEMSDEADAGDIVDQRRIAIGPDDTIAEVAERVTRSYLELLERNLPSLLRGDAPRTPQDAALATYGCKRLREDNRIDWHASARQIRDLIRAVTKPYPGAFTYFRGQRLTVWSARLAQEERIYVGRIAGRVIDVYHGEGVVVLTGEGSILLTSVQPVGGEIAPAWQVIKSITDTLGP